MLTRRTRSEQVGFYLLLTVLAILSFWLIRSYLDIIAFSLMTVVIVKPVYDRVLGWVGGRAGLAVTLTLLVIALVIIVPMWIALSVIASQLGQLIATAQQPGGVPALTAQINAKLAEYLGPEFQIPPALRQKLVEFTVSLGSWVANFLVGLGMGIPSLFARLFIFIGILGALLPNYHSFVIWLKQLSPLDDQIDAIFLRRMKLTIWAMFLAIFVIAVVQGLVMGLFIWFAGVPFTPLWTLIAIVAAMLPLGASLVALPLGGVEMLLGNYTEGVIVLAGYLLVVSNIDSFIRPRLVPQETNLNFALVLLSALGGYELFGFFGVVYGPVLIIMLITAIEVYMQYYAPPAPGSPSAAAPPLAPAPDPGPVALESPRAAAAIAPASDQAPAAPTSAAPSPPEAPSVAAAPAIELAPSPDQAPAAPTSAAPSPPDAWLLDALIHQPESGPPAESPPEIRPAVAG